MKTNVMISGSAAASLPDAGPVAFGPPVKLRRFTPEKVACNIVLAIVGIIFVLPLAWLVEASVDRLATRQIQIPVLSLQNFILATDPTRLLALLNSVIISAIAAFVATLPSTLAAYAFSRHHIPGKYAIVLFILFLSGVPINILIVPVYQMFSSADMLSLGPTAVFLGVTAIPFELYIIKNAIDAIPIDLEEAALMERANTFRILWRVVLPLALPGIMAAAIYGVVNTWGNFLVPLVLISAPEQQPSPLTIFGFMSADITRYGAIAAYSLIYSAPVVILYLVLSRFFRAGFVLGGAIRG
jgi:multiple sugar transport system permease protein